jgi:hypothetical protein
MGLAIVWSDGQKTFLAANQRFALALLTADWN